PIESLWTEIEDLEAQVERKSVPKPKAPPEPSKRVAQPAIEQQAQHPEPVMQSEVVEPSARSVEPRAPQLQLRRNYSTQQDSEFVLKGKRPEGFYGIARAMQANGAKLPVRETDSKELTGMTRAIAANSKSR